MSKSLNEFVYSVLEAVSNFQLNDDFPLSELWVEDQLISQNHTLIRKAHSERKIDAMLYLTDANLVLYPLEGQIEFQGVIINDHKEFCYVDPQELLGGLNGMEVQYVASSSLGVVYTRVPIRSLLRKRANYYSLPKAHYAVTKEKILFRKGEDVSKFIDVSGIWRDPRLVSSWDPDDMFPTPSEKNLEILTIQHIEHAMRFPADLISDAQRALPQQPQKRSKGDTD